VDISVLALSEARLVAIAAESGTGTTWLGRRGGRVGWGPKLDEFRYGFTDSSVARLETLEARGARDRSLKLSPCASEKTGWDLTAE
jgi:hypothetical protein